MKNPGAAMVALTDIEHRSSGLTNSQVLAMLFALAEDQEISISFEYHGGWVQTRGDGEWNEPEMDEQRRGYEVMVAMYGYEDQPYKTFGKAVSSCHSLFKHAVEEWLHKRL